MKDCPNCSAELTQRPCPACGWPETTRRARRKPPLWRRLLGFAGEAAEEAVLETELGETWGGCCGCWLFLVGVCAALGYWLGGQQGAALGAVASAVLAVWVQLDLGGD